MKTMQRWLFLGIFCWPSAHETMLQIYREVDQLRVSVTSPMGYSMMPQMDGPVSPFLIPSIQMQAQELEPLTGQFFFSWPAKNCSVFKPEAMQILCNGPGQTSADEIQPISLRSLKVTEESPEDRVVYFKFRTALIKNGNTYFLSFVFPEKSCRSY